LSQWYLWEGGRQGLVMGFTNVVSAEQAASVALRLAQVIG
jgi:GntR family transcriptional regulator/MocR family aminotransferase